jgi:mRNA interferase YafQ
MRNPILGSKFRRDVKRMEKRGKEMGKLRECIRLLIEGHSLPAQYKDYPLAGDWKHLRDCHVEPDWVLIYKVDGNELHLVRTGTHADLFG